MSRQTTKPRWYIFAIMTLTVFALGLTFWRAPARQFRARTSVIQELKPADRSEIRGVNEVTPWRTVWKKDLEDFRSEYLETPVADGAIEAELAKIGQAGSSPSQRPSIQMHPVTGLPAGSLGIEFETTASSEVGAFAACELLSQRYLNFVLSRRSEEVTATIERVRVRRNVAQSHAEEARQRLDELVTDYFRAERREMTENHDNRKPLDPTGGLEPDGDSTTTHSVAEDLREIRNPEWQTLDAQIVDLQSKVESMLVDRTDTHPEVRELTQRRDQLHELIRDIPEFLPGRDERDSTNGNLSLTGPAPTAADSVGTIGTAADDPRNSASLGNSGSETQKMATQIADLQDECERARVEYSAILQSETDSRRDSIRAAVDYLPQFRLIPARLVVTDQGSNRWRVIGIGIAAVLIGAAGAAFVWREPSDRLVTDTASAKEVLQMPIVGEITSGASGVGTNPRRKKSTNRSRRILLRCSESVLALFFLAFVFSAYTDSQFTRQFLNDPCGTFVRAISGDNGDGS